MSGERDEQACAGCRERRKAQRHHPAMPPEGVPADHGPGRIDVGLQDVQRRHRDYRQHRRCNRRPRNEHVHLADDETTRCRNDQIHQTRHAFWRTIGASALQENACANSGMFEIVPFTR